MSLRWRIALALAAIAAGTTISVGVASYRATSTRLLEEVDSSLHQAWVKIEDSPRSALRDPGLLSVYTVQARRAGRRRARQPGRRPDRHRPRRRRRPAARPEWWSYDTVDVDGADYRIVSGRLPSGSVLQVARSLDENARVLHDLRNRTILLVGLVTVTAAALGWLIARTVTGPLVRLTRAATDVQRSGRLDVEVPVGGHDEVGRLGDAFNGMLGALAASRDDQRRLVEDAGHELRTPLTSVRTNLAVLRRHPDLDPETRAKVLDDLHAETEELVGLVEEVVALARGLTDETAAGAGRARGAGDGRRRPGAPPARPRRRRSSTTARSSMAPPPALERAVSNLVDNAAKFDASSGPIDIEIADGRLVVLDRGPGIARRRRRAGVRPVLPRRRRPLAARLGTRPVDRARGGRARRRHRRGGRPTGRRRGRRLPPARSSTASRDDAGPAPRTSPSTVDVPLEPASGLRPPTPA